MFDLKFVRENLTTIKKNAQLKNENIDVEKITSLDEERRGLIYKRDTIRRERKLLSKQIAQLQKEKTFASEWITKSKELAKIEESLQGEIKKVETQLHTLVSWIPNLVHHSVPRGKREIVREWGKTPKFNFSPLTADELSEVLGIVNFEWGSKVAGSNFPCYKGFGAKLERVLIHFMLEVHIKQGYTEILTPFLVNRRAMFGTAQLPKMEEDMYLIEKDDLFPNPTTEVALINLHANEILNEEDLPIKYTGFSASFRREAGSYGKKTKGLKRVHQFNEVELIKFTKPEESYQELEKMVEEAEEVLQKLGLRYRVVLLPAEELSFASSKTYDIEVWAPVTKEWLEVSSCSNCEDFQARRSKIRYKSKEGLKYVHILNGTGVATPRTFLALIEQYQQEGGKIKLPEILLPYWGEVEKEGV